MASRWGSSSCALCEGSNLPSCCAACVNARLVEYHTRLRMMRSLRDSLHARIDTRLEAKSTADEQRIWRVCKTQDIMELRDRLTELKRKTAIERTKVEQASTDLKAQTASLNLAFVTLKKRRGDAAAMHTNVMKVAQMNLMATTSERLKMQSKSVKQLCRLFPMRRVIKEGEKKDDSSGPYDSICGARLPRGLDPHSIPSEELSASLGYMLHFINIAVRILSAPTLHVSGFKGSCSNIWQRSSYWNTRQSQSKVYPLFIPRKNVCTGGEETSLTEADSGNFGVDSVDSVKKSFDSKRSNSFSFSGASSHSMERHQYLQRGISLLKTSVTAITTYYYNSLGLDVPSNLSTFEAFAKLLHMLSSSKALRAALESNIASRSEKQAQQLNRSIWKASSAISSESSFMDSMHTAIMPSTLDNLLLNSNESFLYTELGRDADEETIKTAYRRLAKFYHPDVYDGKGTLEEGETAEARFIKIQAAYELLIDDERRRAYDREHHVNPMKASQAWMEWVMKKRKAFDQRGDMAVAAWAEQQQREMTLRARRLSRSKVDPEEERKLFAKEKKASMEFYSTTLKRHTLVLRKRDIMRKKAEEERNNEISRLLAAEGLELDTEEDEDKTFLG